MTRPQEQVDATVRKARETGEELGAGEGTIDLAERMASVAAHQPGALTKDEDSVAAACLYAASLVRGPKLSQEAIANADATTAVTIRKHYRWVIEAYAGGAERIPTDVQKALRGMGFDV